MRFMMLARDCKDCEAGVVPDEKMLSRMADYTEQLVQAGAWVAAGCAIVGVVHACRGRYDRHRRWMLRSYVLICSAVALRLMSGTAGLVGVPSAEAAYVVAAWSSWLLPLAAYEIVERLAKHRPAIG